MARINYSDYKNLERILKQFQSVSDQLKAKDDPNYALALGTTDFYYALGALEAFIREAK